MTRKRWLLALGVLLALALAAAAVLLLPRPAAPAPTVTPSPPHPVSPSPTSAPPTADWGALPTVTPLPPDQPTVPPEALQMRAAPTATPGEPPTLTPTATSTPTPTPYPTPVPVPAGGEDDVEMVEVPAGPFKMGANEEQYTHWEWQIPPAFSWPVPEYATPQLLVDLDTFFIDRVEVTNARYRRCVEAGVCSPTLPSLREHEDYADDPRYNDYPAFVTWYQAQTYCLWVGKHLPTEAEWEKAARGTDERLYPWGDQWSEERLNTDYADRAKYVQEVGSYPSGASPYGVLGMISMIGEWTLDRLRPYPGYDFLYGRIARTSERTEERVMRGEGWRDFEVLVVARYGRDPTGNHRSFRCVAGRTAPDWRAAAEPLVDPTPTPVPTLVPTREPDLSDMAYVPAGWFLMGTNEPLDDEYQPWRSSPAHPVYLDAYYIDRYEVTQAAYAEFLNALPTIYDACGGYDCNSGGVGVDDETGAFVPREENWPVAGLSWENADAYCRWRGKRLPTEAEWEKAARGTDGRRYPWGDEEREEVLDQILGPYDSFVFYDVGSVPEDVSPYGVWDVLGGVSEWTADWYDPNYYVYSPSHNPVGPSEGKVRVARSRPMSPDCLREGVVWRDGTTAPGSYVGIRCAYSPTSTP